MTMDLSQESPEATATEPLGIQSRKSRRNILAAAAGAVAGFAASMLGRPQSASAAAGDPLLLGNTSNSAGTADTSMATTSAGTALLVTQNGSGTALRGSAVGAGSIAGFFTANNGTGISGVTGNSSSYGVFAANNGAAGSGGAIRASGVNNHGVVATTANNGAYAIKGQGANGTAIYGSAIQIGVQGVGYRGVVGTAASSFASAGVSGQGGTGTDNYGVLGTVNNATGRGVYGTNDATDGVGFGVYGQSASTNSTSGGVYGKATGVGGNGVFGDATGTSIDSVGVWGRSADPDGEGVLASNTGGGLAFRASGNSSVQGDLAINGTLSKGAGSFKIDHPLAPTKKWLFHSFVESPDMKNVYDGVVTLDAAGTAKVSLPDWFQALNRDFRYQLTAIGSAAPNLHVSSGVSKNAFAIAGGPAGQQVSWQVTGIRQDAFANANRIEVEVAKTGKDAGKYLHPTAHGKSASAGVTYAKG